MQDGLDTLAAHVLQEIKPSQPAEQFKLLAAGGHVKIMGAKRFAFSVTKTFQVHMLHALIIITVAYQNDIAIIIRRLGLVQYIRQIPTVTLVNKNNFGLLRHALNHRNFQEFFFINDVLRLALRFSSVTFLDNPHSRSGGLTIFFLESREICYLSPRFKH
jgi:hypothetical protein